MENSPKCEKKEGIFQRYDKYRSSIKKDSFENCGEFLTISQKFEK